MSAEALLLLITAALLPALEHGFWKFAAPIVNLTLVAACYAFYRRVKYSDDILKGYCLAGSIAGSVYFLNSGAPSISQVPVQTFLLAIETLLLIVLFVFLNTSQSKAWFSSKAT
ncbi:hypothetical protein [Nevskia sp.]|uniref:hypothetical protein n=1 Tax=Nevskia sp. TaxID=1929292 RepID=UPI0025E3BC6F|nr:hypothetical protein [Nevskia sp.]